MPDGRFEVAFAQAPVAMVLVGLDRRLLRANAAACVLAGRTEADLVATPVTELLAPPDAGRDELPLTDLIQGATDHLHAERRLRHLSGAFVRVALHASLVRDEDGRPREVMVHLLDVTREREAEERLRRSEAMNAAMLDSLPHHAFSILDEQLRYRHVAGGALETAGWRRDELLDRSLSEVLPVGRGEALLGRLHAALAGESSTFEWPGLRTDTTFLVSVVPLAHDVLGGPSVLMVSFDISDRARQARELQSSNEVLSRANLELSQFAGIVSHDLSEPLAVIDGYLELLARRGLDERGGEYVSRAREEAHRMRGLIVDLLDLARSEATELVRERVDLNLVVAQAVASLQPSIDAAGAAVVVHELPIVAGDATALGQVMQNLLSNAIKFRAEGHAPTVRIDAWRTDELDVLSVSDDGIGIPPGKADAIFDMFGRGDAGERYPGTGIGLGICKRVAERHGGRLWVESASGQGSTFHLALPRAS